MSKATRPVPRRIAVRGDSTSERVRKELHLQFLKPDLLTNDDDVQRSLSEVESALALLGVDAVLDVCLGQPNSVEFLLSIISANAYGQISRHVLDHFPKTQQDFTPTSLSWRLLARLSTSAFFLPHDPDKSLPSFTQYHQSVQNAGVVLEVLPLINPSPATPLSPAFGENDPPFSSKRGTQHARKQSRKANRTGKVVDTAIFRTMGIDVPQTREEAEETAKNVLRDNRIILQTLLDLFIEPVLAPVLKALYIPRNGPDRLSDVQTESSTPLNANSVSTQNIPPAFPHVQPMKAALYFESAEGFGDWHIYISGRASADLRDAKRKDGNMFRIYIKKIKELSKGHFSGDNQKRLTGPGTPIPIFEAKMTRDSRLVYQVDCISEFDSKVERQVIRVFGIYTHAQLDNRLWDSMGYQLYRKGKEYQRRCLFRTEAYSKGDNAVPSGIWPHVDHGDNEELVPLADTRKEDLEELHTLLVLEKFHILSQALLSSILADQDTAHVFQVSPQERDIIEHDHSCYVLGRSGTGKTTTMLFKMLGLENSWGKTLEPGSPRPRQLFVTQSRVLADKVEQYFIKLLESLHMAAHTEGDIVELLTRKKNREEAGLVDRDEAAEWREDLPRRFSELNDGHFPMFITYDKLLALLEADMDQGPDDKTPTASPVQGPATTSDYMLQQRPSFVSYDIFKNEYWPHFPQSLTKGLDPALVFGEFMGVIKGSEQTLAAAQPFLDHDTYVDLSRRTQATFASRRKEIYALFEAYVKKHRERRDYDAADRTHTVLHEMGERGLNMKGKKLDFLYVDEVQDNLLIDAKVLRFICWNPEGLFWAGDTAQTISVGSSFRFNDLKAFLHRLEESIVPQIQSKSTRQPRTFQLATNYRSHGGIVKCAHSIIRLITQFWPNAIDILAEEKGIVDGIKPVFFSGWDEENVRYESFLFGEAGSHIEFGAQQCILVRTPEAREQLRHQVGDIGLILTLYESKGLEFNDVLLFNFFEDSTVDVSQWRVVLNALERSERDGVAAPSFDETKHMGVCNELKFLYVAVTRARKNLWIVDKSDKGAPMRTFWMAQNLVHHHTPGSDTELPKLAVASTPEEWAVMARTLFDNKRYFQAMHSYERAEKPRERAVAYAYYLREQARSTPISRATDLRKRASIEAAEAFIGCANEAAREKNEYLRVAAELFVTIGEYGRAGHAYLAGRRFNDAAKNFRKAGLFSETVSVLQAHWHDMDEAVALPLRDVSRLYFFKQNDLKTAASLFDSLDEKLEFVEDYDLDVARVEILVEEGRYGEAADLHLEEGRTMQAIGLFLRDYQSTSTKESMIKAKDCILNSLWKVFSFAVVVDLSNNLQQTNIKQIFHYVKQVDTGLLQEKERLQIEMFIAIEQGDVPSLRRLGNALLGINDKPAALLCLDHAFRKTQDLLRGTGEQITLSLEKFYSYAALLREFIGLEGPWSHVSVQRLFSVEPREDGQIYFRRGTFMFSSYEEKTRRQFVDDIISLSHVQAQDHLEFALTERLRKTIGIVWDQALQVTALDPCQMYATTRTCNRGRQCQREHNMDKTWFNRRVQFYFILGLILQVRESLPAWSQGSQQRARIRRIWLERVSDTLFPVYHGYGSAVILNTAQIPQAKRGLGFLRDVVKSMLYTLDPYEPKFAFATTLLRSLSLGYLVNREAIRNYINDTKVVNGYRPPHLLRSLGNTGASNYVVHELVNFFQGSEKTSVIAGVLFFKHLLDNRIHVDVIVLCAFMDLLSSSCIFAKRLFHGLHGVTLPRSWILARIPDADRLRGKELRALSLFVEPVQELLHQLHTGADSEHLLYHNRPINDAPPRVRELVIARICRCVCLFGYNMNRRDTQAKILHSVTSLGRGQTMIPMEYSQYVMAEDWSRLGRVATTTLGETPLDEVIVLSVPGGRSLPSHPRIKRVTFKTLAEIPYLLKADGFIESKLRVDAAPFVPSLKPTAENREPDTTLDDSPDVPGSSIEEKEEDTEETKHEDLDAIIQSVASDAARNMSPEAVAVRRKALFTLLKYYRRMVRYRNSFPAAGLPTYRVKYYDLCLKESEKIKWSTTSTYRFVFMGPLVHVLACIEAMLVKVAKDKSEAKARMAKAQHDDLEKVMRDQTKISTLSKELHALQKKIGPSSSLHREKNLEALKTHVMRVFALATEVGMDGQLDMEIAIVYKGIIRERVKKLEQKPVLNVDDLDD